MTADVLFFPIKFHQSIEELRRLSFYQEQYELYQAELSFQTRDWTPWQKKVFKETSHNNVRKTWKLIKYEE